MFFKMAAVTTVKMTIICLIYQLNVIIRSDSVVKIEIEIQSGRQKYKHYTIKGIGDPHRYRTNISKMLFNTFILHGFLSADFMKTALVSIM